VGVSLIRFGIEPRINTDTAIPEQIGRFVREQDIGNSEE
jgi:hypothetical protein